MDGCKVQGSVPVVILNHGIKLFLQQALNAFLMTVSCCVMQACPTCRKQDVKHL